MKESIRRDLNRAHAERDVETSRYIKEGAEDQIGTINDLVRRTRCDGCKPSMSGMASQLSAMHPAARREAALSLQSARGNRFLQGLAVQAKLIVGASDDRYEREADRIADQVMKMPNPAPVQGEDQSCIQRACGQLAIDSKCEGDRNKKGILQRAAISPGPNTVPPIVHEVLQSPGKPLDSSIRAYMEPRFGYDLSHVQVHTGAKAAESAQSMKSLAYTVAPNVVFGAGQYAPTTTEGQQLMAHELAHVIQQTKSLSSKYKVIARKTLIEEKKPFVIATPRPSGYEKIITHAQALAKEEVDRIFIPSWSNSELVEEAKKKDMYLRVYSEDLGSEVQSIIAETLLLMFDEMDKRVKALPIKLGSDGIIQPPEGTRWSSPELAGIVEGVSPFHMIDLWGLFIKKKTTASIQRRGRLPKKTEKMYPEPIKPQTGIIKPRIVKPELEKALPPAPTPPIPSGKRAVLEVAKRTPKDPLDVLKKLALELFTNWALAKQRGIAEAAHDISIYVMAAGIASMAMKVTDKEYYSIPDPDYNLIKPELESWLRASGQMETGMQVHNQGISMGLKAAKDMINKLEERNYTNEVRGSINPEGNIIPCSGSPLDCLGAPILIKPAQGSGVTYLRQLKEEYKNQEAIQLFIMNQLKERGVAPRAIKIEERYRQRYRQ